MLPSLSVPLPYSAAKFQRSSALLEEGELYALFTALEKEVGRLYFYHVGVIREEGALLASIENVVKEYGEYLFALKNNREARSPLSLAMTVDPSTLYTIAVGEGRKIVKFYSPSIHITSNAIAYLPELHTFKEKIYGQELIPWGLQFSYPQLFQDSKTHEVFNPLQEGVNAPLFKEQQRWLRAHTKPTFFLTDRGQVKTAIRLGRECFSWIDTHPKLQEAGISVDHK